MSTALASMGVDNKNVRLVVNIDIPRQDWLLQQQSGRAGRDNQQAVSILLAPKVWLTKNGKFSYINLHRNYLFLYVCKLQLLCICSEFINTYNPLKKNI